MRKLHGRIKYSKTKMDKHLWISSYALSFYPNSLFVAPTQELGEGEL